jgi:nitroreductase
MKTDETIRLLTERASCRKFLDKPVPPDVLHTILRAGVHAPTGGNLQPYSIVKIEDRDARRKLAELNEDQPYVEAAPVSLLFCMDWRRLARWADLENALFSATSSFRHFWISFQDTVIAAQNISTAADAVGLGSVYIGTVLECFKELRSMFGLPRGVFPVVLLCIGYPEKRPEPRNKLPVDVVVHDERYRELGDDELLEAYDVKYKRARIDISEEHLEKISRACRAVGGAEFERKCIDSIKSRGHINLAQRYFGTHYRADEMPVGNDEYIETMREFGFDWFDRFVPYEERDAGR